MINLDEDSLICDLAEVYHIYDYGQYKPSYIGILANGLRESSRIKMSMSDMKIDLYGTLLAAIADRLSVLIWQNTEDGQTGRNKPQSILDSFIKEKKPSNSFENGVDFDEAWERAINGRRN